MRRSIMAALGLLAFAVPCLAVPSGVQRPLGGYPMDYLEPTAERYEEERPYALTGERYGTYDERRDRAEREAGWLVRTERYGNKVEREVFYR